MSEFWHKKQEIPAEVREAIGGMVAGEPVARFAVGQGEELRLLKTDAKTFGRVFALNREYLYRGDYTAPVEENDYIDSDNYLTEDGLEGFAITENGWLISLFSNRPGRGFSRRIRSFVLEKANKLVCILTTDYEDCHLARMYRREYGFEAFAETVNDEQVMRRYYGDAFVDEFVRNNGIPHHIFMVRTSRPIGQVKKFEDYFAAYEYVNREIPNGER